MDLRELVFYESGPKHPWEQSRKEVIRDKIGKIVNKYSRLKDPNRVLLDIGCGDSYVIEQLEMDLDSFSFFGVDINFTDEHLALFEEKFEDKHHVSVVRNLEDLNGRLSRPADVVLLCDVIEHIEDDLGFLSSLHSFPFITSETCFLITVPAYQSLFCSHDTFLGHYRRYTAGLLERTVKAAGYESLEKGYFFISGIPFRMVQTVKEKVLSAKQEDKSNLVHWRGSESKTKTLTSIMLMDYKIGKAVKKMGINLPGLSTYIICRPLLP